MPGDTVLIPQGRYKERVELREGVTLRSQLPGTVTLISPDGGPAVIARRIEAGTIEGVWIQGDLDAPLAIGIQIVDASPTISNVKITGANTGIEVRGASAPLIASSQIANNLGAGLVIAQGAKPRVENNLIAANGNGKPGPAKAWRGGARCGAPCSRTTDRGQRHGADPHLRSRVISRPITKRILRRSAGERGDPVGGRAPQTRR